MRTRSWPSLASPRWSATSTARPGSPEGFDRLIGFGRDLRRRGLPVGTGRIITFCRAAAALLPLRREDLYWAARASLVSRPEDLEAFDDAFAEYFASGARLPVFARLAVPRAPVSEPRSAHAAAPPDELEALAGLVAARWRAAEQADEPDGATALRIVASAVEVLREKSFADLSEEERRRVAQLIRRLAVSAPARSARRTRTGRCERWGGSSPTGRAARGSARRSSSCSIDGVSAPRSGVRSP